MNYTFILLSIFCVSVFSSQVGIGTNNPHNTAILELESETQGLLLTRLTSSQLLAMESNNPPEGMVVYNSTTKQFLGWDGTKWINLSYEDSNTTPVYSTVSYTGNLFVGEVLSSVLSGFTDADGDLEGTPIYIWRSATDNAGGNSSTVGNASNYTLTNADQGKYIQFCAKATATNGASPGVEQCTSWNGQIVENTVLVRINELHYDNPGADINEFVEIRFEAASLPSSTDLANYTVELINGSNNTSYSAKTLDEFTNGGCDGTYCYLYYDSFTTGIQNGAPDGVRLSGPSGSIEYFSYEGTMPGATQITSTEDESSAQVGSIERTVSGGWIHVVSDSKGAVNAN